jgi:ParB family chromosome partitioning protein
MQNKALGRGLSFLLNEEKIPIAEDSKDVNLIDIDLLDASSEQPRKIFDQEKIKELSESIVNYGVLQPILVAKKDNGRYKIIAGERRFRAAKMASITKVPVLIKDLSNKEILEIALIENIQRQDLSAIEEAEAFQKLINEYGYTTQELALSLGKSRSHVANLLRLNNLPESIKLMINDGRLTMGHARCLIGIDDPEGLAQKIIANDLNVRQTEELANNRKKNRLQPETSEEHGKRQDKSIEEDFILLAQSLTEKFGVKVTIKTHWSGGNITFHYQNLDELDSILKQLS